MSPLFGPSPREREHLIETLQSLGPTSINGLSAALSWNPRRTEKVVRDVVRRSEAPIVYDPDSQSVRLPRPTPVRPPSVPTRPEPAPESVSGGYTGSTATAAYSVKSGTLSARPQCSVCHVRLEPTGTGESFYCPQCGRLETRRSATLAAPTASASVPVGPPPLPTPGAPPATRADRRAQEMFAAWVTQNPIPCPKCRTSLKHQSFGQYRCPRCGQSVSFSSAGPTIASDGAVTAPMMPG